MIGKWTLSFILFALVIASPVSAQAPASATDKEATAFRETVKHLDVNGNFLFFVNAADVLKVLDETMLGVRKNVVPLLLEGNPNQKQMINAGQNVLDSLYKTSGVREIGGIGVSNRHLGDGIYRAKAFIQIDPAKKGKLWKLFGETPKPLDYLELLPTTTVGASFSDFDLNELWKWHFELVQATGDGQLVGMHQMVMMGLQQKVDLAKLFAGTSGTFGVVLTLDPSTMITVPAGRGKSVTVPEPGLAIVVKVKDSTVKDFLLSKLTTRKNGKETPLSFTEKTVDGITIRTFNLPLPIPVPVSPSIATIGDYLVLSTTSKLIEGMIAAKTKGTGLKSKTNFKKWMKGLPLEGNSFAFLDPLFTKTAMDVQRRMMAQGNEDQKRALEAVMKVYKQEDTFAISVSRLESNGISVIGTSCMSAPKAFAVQIVKLASYGAGVGLPRVIKGAGKAKQVKCKNNLKQIGLGLLMYAGDNKGAFPKDLGMLYEKDYLKNGIVYVCPATKDTVPRSAADVRAGKCSYVYVGNGVRDDAPNGMKTVIAYDKPSNHGTSINFLFVDGHVESVKTTNPKMAAKERGWVVGPKK